MIQSEYNYNYERYWEQQVGPVQVTRSRKKVKKTNPKARVLRRLIVKTGMLLFIYGIIMVYLGFQGSSLGYQIVDLEKDIERLQISNARLDYEIAQLSSLDSIEQRARQELGMEKPDMTVALTIPTSAFVPVNTIEEEAVEEETAVTAKAMDLFNSAIQYIAAKTQ